MNEIEVSDLEQSCHSGHGDFSHTARAGQVCLLERLDTLPIKLAKVWQAQAGLPRKGKSLCKENSEE